METGMRHLGKVQGAIAAIVVLGFLALTAALMFAPDVKQGLRDALLMMAGTLSTGFGVVLSYYFGSSSGSAQKNALIAEKGQPAAPTDKPPPEQ